MSRPQPTRRRRRGVMTERWGWQPLAWEQNGLPTWRYGFAPRGLLTRRQMRAEGLAPGGSAPVAQVVVRGQRRHRPETRAQLWDRDQLVAKRVASPAQLVALERALAARRWCPSCRRDVGYCVPTSLGECVGCAFPDLDQPDDQQSADQQCAEQHSVELEVSGDDVELAA